MIGRNDLCWCGSRKKWKKCHYPDAGAANGGNGSDDDIGKIRRKYRRQYDIIIKTPEQIAGIRRAGHLAAKFLDAICERAKVGVTTEELNSYALELHKEAGARPATLGYGEPPFPKALCTSLNDVICHGIADDTPLKDGDIMNVDVTPILDGYYGDCSKMVMIGDITAEKALVVDVAYQSLMRAAKVIRPGALISDIGAAIEKYATGRGCSVVHQFVAHGVGVDFHEGPQISHCKNRTDIPMTAGMTFTIEPMINAGVPTAIIDPDDKWTARTQDGAASAQWEHTFLVTDDGYEILTP